MTTLVAFLPTLIPMMVFLWSCVVAEFMNVFWQEFKQDGAIKCSNSFPPQTDDLWRSSSSIPGNDRGVSGKPQETANEMPPNNGESSPPTLNEQECDELYAAEFKIFYLMDTCLEYFNFEFHDIKQSYKNSFEFCEQYYADYTDYKGELVSNDFTDEQWRMIPALSVRNETVKFYTNEGPTEEDPDLCSTIHLTDDGSNENYTDFTIIRGQTDPCHIDTGLDYVCIISN